MLADNFCQGVLTTRASLGVLPRSALRERCQGALSENAVKEHC